MIVQPLTERIFAGVMGAVLIGGGTAIMQNWFENGVQAQQLHTLERRIEQTETVLDQLADTNQNIAILNERLSWIIKESERHGANL